jgi:hypothetical protein
MLRTNDLPITEKAAQGQFVYESLRDALEHATGLTSALMELCERFPDVQHWKQWRDQAIALQRRRAKVFASDCVWLGTVRLVPHNIPW